MAMMDKVVVWFDGGCPLCRREIAFMRRLDRRGAVTFLDVQEAGAVCPLPRDDLLERLHASENGRLLSGAAAFAAMWRAIPLLRPLGLLARSPPVLSALEHLYLVFLKVRPALQRLICRLEGSAANSAGARRPSTRLMISRAGSRGLIHPSLRAKLQVRRD